MARTAVLAYSGGLDTSCAIAWLKEDYGFDEVVAVLVDVGQDTDFEPAIARGYAAGATDVVLVDRKDAFADEQVAKALLANALYEGKYPLVSALSRPVIAETVAGIARGPRRRGGRPRLHRQGQRPAPLRARLQGALPGREGDRAAARQDLDARRGDRLRGGARHPGRGEGREAVLRRRQPRRARDRGRRARGSVGRTARGRVRADGLAARGALADRGRDRVRERPAGLSRRRAPLARRADRLAERARRPLRDRADRHDREPLRGHQEPRALRGPGCDDADRGAWRARGPRPHEGGAAT